MHACIRVCRRVCVTTPLSTAACWCCRIIDVDQSGQIEIGEFLRFAAPLENSAGSIELDHLEHRIEQMALTLPRHDSSRAGTTRSNGEGQQKRDSGGTGSSRAFDLTKTRGLPAPVAV